MGSKSRERIYGGQIRATAERARAARKEADRLACEAWNARMLGYQGPAQPSPTIGDALNAGYCYLEVRCLGCDTNQTVALDVIRRPEDHTDPRTRALYATQGLFATPRLSASKCRLNETASRSLMRVRAHRFPRRATPLPLS
jgi:hypothetical protein